MNIDPQELEQDIAEVEEQAEKLSLEELTALGIEAWEIDKEITELEQTLKDRKSDLKKIMERTLPEALMVAGLSEFGFETPAGTRARMMTETKVLGTLRNAPDQEAAIKYLEASGFEGAVKTNVSIDLTEEEREQLEKVMDDIGSVTGKYPNAVRNINAGTLAAFGRQKLKDDPTWDFAKVGLNAYPNTKFTAR